MDAQRVAGVEDPVEFIPLRNARQLDLDLVLAGLESDVAELEPGDLGEERNLHQVGGQLLGRHRLPLAAIDPPGEGGASELETDAVPDFVLRFLGEGEIVAEECSLGGDFLGDLVGVDGYVQPGVAGEEVLVAPAAGIELDVGGRRFLALDPGEIGGVGRRGRKPGE